MKFIVLIGICLAATVSVAQRKPASQVQLEKQIAAYCKAMHEKDLKAIEGILAPDFTTTNMKGQTASRKEVLDGLTGLFKQVKSLSISCKIAKFKAEKNGLRIVSVNDLDIQMTGPDGKPGKFTNVSSSDELWILSGGVYKVKSSKQLTNIATFNGKVVTGG